MKLFEKKVLFALTAIFTMQASNATTILLKQLYMTQQEVIQLLILQKRKELKESVAKYWANTHHPIFGAIVKNDLNLVKKIYSQKTQDLSLLYTDNGMTLLMFAAGFGNPEIVKLIIENGADVAGRGRKSWDELRSHENKVWDNKTVVDTALLIDTTNALTVTVLNYKLRELRQLENEYKKKSQQYTFTNNIDPEVIPKNLDRDALYALKRSIGIQTSEYNKEFTKYKSSKTNNEKIINILKETCIHLLININECIKQNNNPSFEEITESINHNKVLLSKFYTIKKMLEKIQEWETMKIAREQKAQKEQTFILNSQRNHLDEIMHQSRL